jgi:hypothetical protein
MEKDFIDKTSKPQEIKVNIDKIDLHQTKKHKKGNDDQNKETSYRMGDI